MTDAVKPCPNPECRAECRVGVTNVATGCPWDVRCPECGYHGPYGHVTVYGTPEDFSKASRAEAIRLHNLICTPPAGWKLVPVEPTEKMIDAGLDYFKDYFSDGAYVGNEGVKYSYKTIIEAAPENDDE